MIETVAVEPDLVQFRTRRKGWPSSCNVYLVRDGAGSVLVDTGLGVEPDLGLLLAAIDAALASWEQQRSDLATIVLTHTHTDHAGGTVGIARATGAKVLLPAIGWAQASDYDWLVHHILPPDVQRELTKHRDFDAAMHFRNDAMPDLFVRDAGIDYRMMEDGDEIAVGRFRLKAFHMPGHDVGHLAWVDLATGLAFTGDLFTARGTSLPWYPPNAGGVAGYLDSLRRLAELPLQIVCPGHHTVIRGAGTITALNRSTTATVQDRDRRILSTLLAEPATFATLDDLIYDAAVRDVIPWASSVTMAHLQRLEQKGLLFRRADGRFVAEPVGAQRYLATLADAPA